ncbi:MAG TPA: GAF domain-containing protein [Candidatus Limnocylindrales bacterium]|nr:GAF domain-containing protein [Candidatus Limnocylindrales bacterium]
MTGPTRDDAVAGDDPLPEHARTALREIVRRAAVAGHLAPPAGEAVLRSIVEATVALFGAEAASLALYDPTADRLVFRVAAGARGDGVVGLAIRPDQGVAGYVFTTGQPLALSDVERDARFGRAAAEQTGYVPRSLVAVPLLDEEGTIGVLEVLDKRDAAGFDLRDVELAAVFARQAAVAIRSSRLERDVRTLVRDTLARLAAGDGSGAGEAGDGRAGDAAAIEALVADAARSLDGEEDDALWALADEIARIRSADPGELDLVREFLAVIARRAERSSDARTRRRGR